MQDHLFRRVVYGNGEVRQDVNVTWTEEQYREFTQGYRCAKCYVRVPHAFPETCGTPGCDGYPDGFPMREKQRQALEDDFDGMEWIGLSRETAERLANEIDKQGKPKGDSHIWIPGKD